MKFTYNVGDKLVAKEVKTVGNIFNRYVVAGSVVILVENISNHNGYELIKVKSSNGINFTTSASYFEPYIEEEEKNVLTKDNVINILSKFMIDNLDEEDLDDLMATAAVLIENAHPGFLERYKKSKEKCCEGKDCNCSEDCNCLCEDCECGDDKEIEETVSEAEAYSGKIYCVKSGYGYITEGKIYEVKKGVIEADDGWKLKFSSGTRVLSTFEEFSKALRGEWIEVKETEEIISPSNYEADIICVYSGPIENFTKGKIYRVENGYLYDDKKNKISWYGAPFTDINGINSYCASNFKEIKH